MSGEMSGDNMGFGILLQHALELLLWDDLFFCKTHTGAMRAPGRNARTRSIRSRTLKGAGS